MAALLIFQFAGLPSGLWLDVLFVHQEKNGCGSCKGVKTCVCVLSPLAGFEVTIIGRFWGDHRGPCDLHRKPPLIFLFSSPLRGSARRGGAAKHQESSRRLLHVFRTRFARKHGPWNVDHALTPGTFVGMKDRLICRNDELAPGGQTTLHTLRDLGLLP